MWVRAEDVFGLNEERDLLAWSASFSKSWLGAPYHEPDHAVRATPLPPAQREIQGRHMSQADADAAIHVARAAHLPRLVREADDADVDAGRAAHFPSS